MLFNYINPIPRGAKVPFSPMSFGIDVFLQDVLQFSESAPDIFQ